MLKCGCRSGPFWALPLVVILLAACAATTSESARAHHLDRLFVQLKQAADVDEGQALEAQIWELWSRSGDEPVDVLMTHGIYSMAQGDAYMALVAFDTVTRMAPHFAEGWNKRATVGYLLGYYEQSRRDILKTLELEPRHFGALSGLGLVHAALGDDERALAAFRAALEIHPTLRTVRTRVNRLARKLQASHI